MSTGNLFHQSEPFSPQLNSEQRARGQRRFRGFLLLNGISVALLMENMLILFAIRNGASDPVVAVIASFIHLTMPAMILGKRWVARMGLSRTLGIGWFLRYASAMLLVLAPVATQLGSPLAGIGLIVAGAFGFGFFRSIGAIANTPLTGEITTPGERGSFIAGNMASVQSTYVVTMAAVVLLLRVNDSLWVYQAIIAVGCVVGFYASTVVARVPESVAPQRSADISLASVVRNIFGTRRLRRLFYGWCAGFVSFAVVIPFAMIAVKNGYGLSDYEALSFSLVLVLGSISSALLNGLIADRVGPRPLVVIYLGGLLLVATFWAFAPALYQPVLVGAAFYLAGVSKTGIITGLGHYFLSTADTDQRVGAALVMRVASGAAAGVAGSVLGATLLDVLRLHGTGLEVYQGYFRIMLVPLVIFLIVVMRLERLAEWRISNVFGLIFSPRDLRALFVLNRLRRRDKSSDAVEDLRTLERIGARVSEEEIREQLNSPRLDVRVRAIRAMRTIEIGEETEAALIGEVRHGAYTTASVAAETLGASGRTNAAPALREALESGDHLLQSRCMTALVRLNDVESYEQIVGLFETTDNPRVAVHGANALAQMGGPENLRRILGRAVDASLPSGVRDELLTAAGSIVGAGPQLYRFLRHYNTDRQQGVAEVLPDLHGAFDEQTVERIQSESSGENTGLTHFRRALRDVAARVQGEQARAVASFLDDYDPPVFPRRLAFAVAMILSAIGNTTWDLDEQGGGVVGPTAH